MVAKPKPKTEKKDKKEAKPKKATKPKKAKKAAKKEKPKSKAEKPPKKAAKAKKPKKDAKPKKGAGKSKEKKPHLTMKRGWALNQWEIWLAERFEEDPGPITHKELQEDIKGYVREHDGPKNIGSVIRNSIRRLVRENYVTRQAAGQFVRGPHLTMLKVHKTEIGQRADQARKETPWSRQDMANLLGHKSAGRYATLEQGRTHMRPWEAHTIARALNVDLFEGLESEEG